MQYFTFYFLLICNNCLYLLGQKPRICYLFSNNNCQNMSIFCTSSTRPCKEGQVISAHLCLGPKSFVLHSKHVCLLLQWETLPRLLSMPKYLKRQSRTKAIGAFPWETYRNSETHEQYLPDNHQWNEVLFFCPLLHPIKVAGLIFTLQSQIITCWDVWGIREKWREMKEHRWHQWTNEAEETSIQPGSDSAWVQLSSFHVLGSGFWVFPCTDQYDTTWTKKMVSLTKHVLASLLGSSLEPNHNPASFWSCGITKLGNLPEYQFPHIQMGKSWSS
jgi:hypothetical protein